MKKMCSKCGKTTEYNSRCECRTSTSYNTTISLEKRKFYSSYAWLKLRNRKVKHIKRIGRLCHSKSKGVKKMLQYLERINVDDYNRLRNAVG